MYYSKNQKTVEKGDVILNASMLMKASNCATVHRPSLLPSYLFLKNINNIRNLKNAVPIPELVRFLSIT